MPSAVPSRRAVLRGLGVGGLGFGALSTLPACTSGPRGDAPASPGRDPDPDLAVVTRALAASLDLAQRYAATAAALPELAGVLGPLAGEHDAHIDALGGAPTPVPAPSPVPTSPTLPTSRPEPTEALAALAAAERAVAAERVADVLTASPRVARLLASIAASQAAHAVILGLPR